MNIITKDKLLIEKIQSVVGKLVDNNIKEDETIVIMYSNRNNWAVQLYPNRPDLDTVDNLLSSFLLQVKSLKEKLNKQEEEKKREPYTI